MSVEFNPLCPCKECTGEGLGWIKHLTPKQSRERLDRLAEERRTRQQEEDGIAEWQRL